jgi:cyclic di-GMP phosphodiesterase
VQRMSPTSAAQLLVIDDEAAVQDLLTRWLRDAGYACARASSAAAGWAHLQKHAVDLVTLDIRMPGESGLDLLDRIKPTFPDVAVLMLTGEGDTTKAIRALTRGACGYLIKPIAPEELVVQVGNGLERRRLLIENREYTERLEERVREQTRAIRLAHEETIHCLVKASLYRDEETGAHIKRTGWCSELLAATAGWDPEQVDRIRLAAPMHDIGKIGIPDAILRKPGKLTPQEMSVMQTHTLIGARMLDGSTSPVHGMAKDIALCHHERWDARGYPSGLRATEIPEAARIVSIVDVYDAVTHDRVYRPALPEAEVLRLMWEGRGTQFDPSLLDVFMSVLPEMRAIAQALSDDFDEEDLAPRPRADQRVELAAP